MSDTAILCPFCQKALGSAPRGGVFMIPDECQHCRRLLELSDFGRLPEPPDWRIATCGACEFRMPRAAHSCCRRFPANERPRILDEAPEYPLVFDDTPACAEFRQKELSR